jgi:rhodanese-related sulfurtransferase
MNALTMLRMMRGVLLCAVAGLALGVQAIEQDKVPEAKRSASGLHLTATEAAAMKQRLGSKVMMVDIRSRAEAQYVGMANSVDFLVPMLDFPEFWEWSEQRNEFIQQSNPNFVKDVEKRLAQMGLTKDDPVVVICRSGVRSNAASGLLFEMGFKQAYTVIDGFEGDTAKDGPEKGHRVVNGWKNAKLPWSYKLDKNKMYLDPL